MQNIVVIKDIRKTTDTKNIRKEVIKDIQKVTFIKNIQKKVISIQQEY